MTEKKSYNGPLFDEARDKPRLHNVKVIVAWLMTKAVGHEGWWTVPKIHSFILTHHGPCREDTVRRMIGKLIEEGTETHTFHRGVSTTNPGTAVYCARRKP